MKKAVECLLVLVIVFVGLTNVDESMTMPVAWAKDKFYDNESIVKYNESIKTLCDSNQIAFIDMQGLLMAEDLADGLHPNTAGHQKMFERVKASLQI